VLGNASRYVPRRGFSAAQPGVAGIPATPGYRPTRRAGGRAHRSIDSHGPAETATDGALNRGNFTAPHGLPVAHNKNADSIATIPRGFDFGLGDVDSCRWAGALDRETRRRAGGTQGSRDYRQPWAAPRSDSTIRVARRTALTR
jgi:hypothetical protein